MSLIIELRMISEVGISDAGIIEKAEIRPPIVLTPGMDMRLNFGPEDKGGGIFKFKLRETGELLVRVYPDKVADELRRLEET